MNSCTIPVRMSLPVFSAKRNHSRSTTPTVMASTQAAAAAQSRWQPCPFTLPYWSITCHRCRRVERKARPRPLPCPERERGNERGSGRRTARERKATGERGARGNWCSSQTEGGGGVEGRVARVEACSLLADSQRRRIGDEQGETGRD